MKRHFTKLNGIFVIVANFCMLYPCNNYKVVNCRQKEIDIGKIIL